MPSSVHVHYIHPHDIYDLSSTGSPTDLLEEGSPIHPQSSDQHIKIYTTKKKSVKTLRITALVLFLLAGASGGLAYGLHNPSLTRPLVGAAIGLGTLALILTIYSCGLNTKAEKYKHFPEASLKQEVPPYHATLSPGLDFPPD